MGLLSSICSPQEEDIIMEKISVSDKENSDANT